MRLDDFSKKQATEANRLWALQVERGKDSPHPHLLDTMSTVLNRFPGWAEGREDPAVYLNKRLGTVLSSMSSEAVEMGLGARIQNDDPQAQASALILASRLNCLSYATPGGRSSGQDCLHIKEVLYALSVKNWACVDAFMRVLPGPSVKGHAASMRNVNLLYAILKNDRVTAEQAADLWAADRSKEKQVYDQALTDGLLAIVAKDGAALSDALTVLVAKHDVQKDFHLGGMGKFFCWPAHALYTLATAREGIGAEAVSQPEGQTWDSAYQTLIDHVAPEQMEPFVDFTPASAKLAEWLHTLPTEVSALELL